MAKKYRFLPKLVTFLDILGIKGKIDSAGTDPDKLESALEHIMILRKYFKGESKGISTVRTHVFSDSLVRERALPSSSLYYEVLDLSQGLIESTNTGVIVRGGLSHGPVCSYTNTNLVFGLPFKSAYELESKNAKYPRVIISKDTIKDIFSSPEWRDKANGLSEEIENLREVIRFDPVDGYFFVDYLKNSYGIFIKTNWEKFTRFLTNHRSTVISGLSGEPDFIEKYIWLGIYHNAVIQEFSARALTGDNGRDVSNYLIPEELLRPHEKYPELLLRFPGYLS